MKELYSLTVNKEKEVEVSQETPEGFKLTKTELQQVPIKVILRKPNRKQSEELDKYYAACWSEYVEAGILTKPQVLKKYSDGLGAMSNSEEKNYVALYSDYFKLRDEYAAKVAVKEDVEELKVKIEKAYLAIQEIEGRQSSLFENTAEVKARNKTIQWLVLMLTFIEEDGKEEPAFKGNTLDEKADFYFEANEEGNQFLSKVIEKSALMFSFWYMSRTSSREDFAELEKRADG